MPWRIYNLDFKRKIRTGIRTSDLQITNLALLLIELFVNWIGNVDSSIGKSTRLVIWRSEVRIPVQVWIFLLKCKLNIYMCTKYAVYCLIIKSQQSSSLNKTVLFIYLRFFQFISVLLKVSLLGLSGEVCVVTESWDLYFDKSKVMNQTKISTLVFKVRGWVIGLTNELLRLSKEFVKQNLGNSHGDDTKFRG